MSNTKWIILMIFQWAALGMGVLFLILEYFLAAQIWFAVGVIIGMINVATLEK